MTPQTRAEAAARHMMASDAASQCIGARIDDIGPDRATLSMRVRPDMLNGHGMCHGGITFSLADSAFAFACNADNVTTVAQSNQITYLSPGRASERLTAYASKVAVSGRSGTYDVSVLGEDGRTVALFRGLSRQLGKPIFNEKEPS